MYNPYEYEKARPSIHCSRIESARLGLCPHMLHRCKLRMYHCNICYFFIIQVHCPLKRTLYPPAPLYFPYGSIAGLGYIAIIFVYLSIYIIRLMCASFSQNRTFAKSKNRFRKSDILLKRSTAQFRLFYSSPTVSRPLTISPSMRELRARVVAIRFTFRCCPLHRAELNGSD